MKHLLLVPVVAFACNDKHPATVDAPPDAPVGFVDVATVPVTVNHDVDLLFVIDDSSSTADKQNNLKANFPAFINTLASLPGGLPNIHLGVATSDLGTSSTDDAMPATAIGSGPGMCAGTGKNGVLQTFGAPVTGNFISDIGNTDGSRTKNYTGTLADAFTTMASAGANGCGIEQHLEAAKRALSPATTANAGFLRPSASLAIIVLADEDDCSVKHGTLFGNDTATLGPLQSFRCTRFGVSCDQGGSTPDEMNQIGEKVSCHSNTTSPYVADVEQYATFFKGLKTDPSSVVFGAIIGNVSPVAVELRTPSGGGTAIPALAHSCTYVDAQNAVEVADPGVRIAQVAGEFERGVVTTVCQPDLSAAETMIAQQIRSLAGDVCLTRDISLPADCTGTATNSSGTAAFAMCGTSAADCFAIAADSTACPGGQHLKVALTLGGSPPPDTIVHVRCKP